MPVSARVLAGAWKQLELELPADTSGPLRVTAQSRGGDTSIELPAGHARDGWCATHAQAAAVRHTALAVGDGRLPVSLCSHNPASASETLLLEISVNDQPLDGIHFVERLDDGRLALPADAWLQARLKPLDTALTLPDGRLAYVLEAIPGLIYQLDMARLTLAVTAPAGAFEGSLENLRGDGRPVAERPPPGFYVDYDLSSTLTRDGSSKMARSSKRWLLTAWVRWSRAGPGAQAHGEAIRFEPTPIFAVIYPAPCAPWSLATPSARPAAGAGRCAMPVSVLPATLTLHPATSPIRCRRFPVPRPSLDGRCADQQPAQRQLRGATRTV